MVRKLTPLGPADDRISSSCRMTTPASASEVNFSSVSSVRLRGLMAASTPMKSPKSSNTGSTAIWAIVGRIGSLSERIRPGSSWSVSSWPRGWARSLFCRSGFRSATISVLWSAPLSARRSSGALAPMTRPLSSKAISLSNPAVLAMTANNSRMVTSLPDPTALATSERCASWRRPVAVAAPSSSRRARAR